MTRATPLAAPRAAAAAAPGSSSRRVRLENAAHRELRYCCSHRASPPRYIENVTPTRLPHRPQCESRTFIHTVPKRMAVSSPGTTDGHRPSAAASSARRRSHSASPGPPLAQSPPSRPPPPSLPPPPSALPSPAPLMPGTAGAIGGGRHRSRLAGGSVAPKKDIAATRERMTHDTSKTSLRRCASRHPHAPHTKWQAATSGSSCR